MEPDYVFSSNCAGHVEGFGELEWAGGKARLMRLGTN